MDKYIYIATWNDISTTNKYIKHNIYLLESSTSANNDFWLGFLCVMISCLTSAFAGVYFEKILKGKNSSIWIKNIQLSIWSLLLCTIEMSVTSSQIIIQKGFFNAYTFWVYFIIKYFFLDLGMHFY